MSKTLRLRLLTFIYPGLGHIMHKQHEDALYYAILPFAVTAIDIGALILGDYSIIFIAPLLHIVITIVWISSFLVVCRQSKRIVKAGEDARGKGVSNIAGKWYKAAVVLMMLVALPWHLLLGTLFVYGFTQM